MTTFLLIFIFLASAVKSETAGFFWQISDLHLDRNYSIHGDSRRMCHGNDVNQTLSRYGNYKCDSPWDLIKAAIDAMKNIHSMPDFILWTGDIMAHLPEEELSWPDVFTGLSNATQQILDEFPESVLIPVIGNHDVYPANQIPAKGFEKIYEKYLKEAGWGDLIPSDQYVNFLKGGYYTKPINDQLKIIVLNTNLYLSHNKNKSKDTDPDEQLGWLEQQLTSAKNDHFKVVIVAHAPPGYFERNPIEPFLASPFNEIFIKLMINYSDVILTQIYGHTHTDTFRLFKRDGDDVVQSHGFIAPSVSPLKLPATNGINPSIRLYTYNINMMLDYEQYYLNLSEVINSDQLDWKLLYKATELYGVENLSLQSLYHIFLDISINRELFDKYYLYNVAGVRYDYCNQTCHQIHICAIMQLTEEDMHTCLLYKQFPSPTTVAVLTTAHATPFDDHNRHHRGKVTPGMKMIILGVAMGLFVMLIIMTIIASAYCVRRRISSGFRYKKHSVLSG